MSERGGWGLELGEGLELLALPLDEGVHGAKMWGVKMWAALSGGGPGQTASWETVMGASPVPTEN